MTKDEYEKIRRVTSRMDSGYDRCDLLQLLVDNPPEVAPVTKPFGPTEGREIAEMIACLMRGQRIYAIKALRAATGGGLKECKDTVEAVERVLTGALGYLPRIESYYPVKSRQESQGY